jgi:hypothetical protein
VNGDIHSGLFRTFGRVFRSRRAFFDRQHRRQDSDRLDIHLHRRFRVLLKDGHERFFDRLASLHDVGVFVDHFGLG